MTTTPLTPEEQLDADIKEWQGISGWMKQAKDREMELRKKIADAALGKTKLANGAFPEGTQKGTAVGSDGQRYAVVLVTQWKRDVLPEMINAVWTQAKLTPDEAKDLLKYTPEMSVRAYRKLPEAKQLVIDQMLNCKQGSITLEVIPLPK